MGTGALLWLASGLGEMHWVHDCSMSGAIVVRCGNVAGTEFTLSRPGSPKTVPERKLGAEAVISSTGVGAISCGYTVNGPNGYCFERK